MLTDVSFVERKYKLFLWILRHSVAKDKVLVYFGIPCGKRHTL